MGSFSVTREPDGGITTTTPSGRSHYTPPEEALAELRGGGGGGESKGVIPSQLATTIVGAVGGYALGAFVGGSPMIYGLGGAAAGWLYGRLQGGQ